MDLSFYKDKKVLITGHTGFKGSWMCQVLFMAGAKVTGYALKPPTEPSLFEICGLHNQINSIEGDIRDLEKLKAVFQETQPEIVIHMAAQPIVRESYVNPVYTFETNVMGTVNVCECVRSTRSVKSFVNVTTDKVYRNNEWDRGYVEEDYLNGYDPYSNSKSCSELVTSSYVNSFLCDLQVATSTARAGNVIGGGDFAKDRIIPDCVRAAEKGEEIVVRNPNSIRPYQHVLEPVMAYLMIAQRQYEDESFAGSYNVGPNESDCYTTGEIVQMFCDTWNEEMCDEAVTTSGFKNEIQTKLLTWHVQGDGGPHEANFLKLDCTKLKNTFGWQPKWSAKEAIQRIVAWEKVYLAGEDVGKVMMEQIEEYLRGMKEK